MLENCSTVTLQRPLPQTTDYSELSDYSEFSDYSDSPFQFFTFSPFHLFNLWLKGQSHTACRSTPPLREAAAGFWASRPIGSTVRSAGSTSGQRFSYSRLQHPLTRICNSFSCVPPSINSSTKVRKNRELRKKIPYIFRPISDNNRQ